MKTIDEIIQRKIIKKETIESVSIEEVFGKDTKNIEQITQAFQYSKDFYEEHDMKRICGNAYFIHPYSVAKILSDIGASSQAIITGLLHDILEDARELDLKDKIPDQNGSKLKQVESYIKQNFGEKILELTRIVSTKLYGKERQGDSIKAMFKEIDRINNPKYAETSILVKLADAIDNIENIYAVRNDFFSNKIKSDLNIKKQQNMIQNAIEVMEETSKYFKEKSYYSKETDQLYQRLTTSLKQQIEHEIRCNELELGAMDSKDPGKYKKAIEEGAKHLLEKPRYNYLKKQLKSKISKKAIKLYATHFREDIEKHQSWLEQKLGYIKNMQTINQN